MKKSLLLLPMLVPSLLLASPAFAGKSCEELKTEISKKLDDKGVKGYTLDVVETASAGDQKIVGSCEAGSKKIVYKKN